VEHQRSDRGRWVTAGKALVALIGATGCLAAVAYAASSQGPTSGREDPLAPRRSTAMTSTATAARHRARRAPMPRIAKAPTSGSPSSEAEFRLLDRKAGVGFQCKLDRAKWHICGTRILYRNLSVGIHRFSVRASARGLRSSAAARFSWSRVEPKDFSITPQLAGLAPLYPGDAPQSLPVVLGNPNSEPIFVTALGVEAGSGGEGCSGVENLQLGAAGASMSTPVMVPAESSVTLPAQGVSAPTIAMRELPVSQDACQGAGFPLQFIGEARG
jgi:hypothetical protein